ncbi:MAG: hypothetical protein LBB67_04155 [Oscillospiraceae bacterium]|nr:hypothetical protein [Oscillospiraceae bacterium]
MEQYIKEQATSMLRYAVPSLVASVFRKHTSPEIFESKRKAGGFIKGICHPNENFAQIKGAGIRWNREDLPFPFNADGSVSQNWLNCKAKIKRYVDAGIKIMAVTPYPREYIEAGLDPRLPENEARVREAAVFMIKDLKGLVSAFQITNEMGVPRFINPLTMEEAVRFIGIHLAAMHPYRGDILIGYNSAGPQANLHVPMKAYHKYCDYIGIDIYIGCFAPATNWFIEFGLLLRYLYGLTGKPIILTEFGYISGGAPKTKEEKTAVLQRYGVSSEKEAREDIQTFVSKLNTRMQDQVKNNASGDWGDFLFQLDFCNHLYSELPKHTVIPRFPHTPEGQAGFYAAIFKYFAKFPYLIGTFVYCYQDSRECYVCGQSDCPTETRWGIVDMDGREKPSYYALRDAWKNIK